MTARELITDEVRQQIEAAIHLAEQGTSGEIRVHAEDTYRNSWFSIFKSKHSLMDRAAYVFDQLGMNRTEARNGVLFYISVKDHKVAIIGDVGFNVLVGEDYWKDTLNYFNLQVKEHGPQQAIINTVGHIGEKVKQLFPIKENDINELPNTVTVGKKGIDKTP